jgi:hypothetical protein
MVYVFPVRQWRDRVLVQNRHTYCRQKHGRHLLVSSVYTIRFGRADRPQAFKYMALKPKVKYIDMCVLNL